MEEANLEVPLVSGNGKSDLTDFFNNPQWRKFSSDLNKEKGLSPNVGYFNETENALAVVVFRGTTGSWAFNKASLDYLEEGLENDKIAVGLVILAQKPRAIVAMLEVAEVARKLAGIEPYDGEWGLYWWLDEHFTSTNRVPHLEQAPF
jgi:hypothetical protein